MIKLSFPTRKLGNDIERINTRVKDVTGEINLTVLGVTNSEGITITGNKASEDLSKYIVIKGKQFAYNPYRVNVGSIGLTKEEEGIISPAYIAFKTTGKLIPEFLLYYLKSSIGINLIRWYGNRGGVRDALRYEDLCSIDIPDLTVSQQELALEKIYLFDKQINILNKEIYKQEKELNLLRNSILQDAIQGKIIEQDYNKEPARLLLEMIKKEKDQLIKDKIIKKEKELPPITDDELTFDLPSNWEWVRLRDICYKITDGTHQTPNYTETGSMFLSAQNIKPFKFMPENHRYVSFEDYENYNKNTKPEFNDILLTRVGSNIGESAVIDKDIDFAIYVSLCLIKPFKQYVDPYYICIWLNSPDGTQKSISNILGRGMSQGNLNLTLINNFLIPLPPLEEQKRIVEKVNELMSLCDNLKSNIDKSKQESEHLMKAILQEAFKS